ncbi:MAG TPA: PASTA domain-containing protein [Vicinamibacterales bacterium]|jgi:serine/threonine-protein kinase
MPLSHRVRRTGRLAALALALIATFFVCAILAMRITLTSRDVKVPNLTGQSLAQATSLLSARGLTLKVDPTHRTDVKMAAGLIVAQDPDEGTTTRRERSVRVWVSAGARVNIVPALVGQTERSAQVRVAQNGLTLTRESIVRSQGYPADMVIAQSPAPKSAGSSVALLVNRGQQDVTYLMPDFIGVDAAQASSYLRAHGFRVAVVSQQPYPGVPAGVVLRQNPQAGFQISPGQAIAFEVSQ